jgi:cerevisin
MNSGVLGFYDLKLLPETTDIYAATIQGEGVDIIIGDCQLNIHNSDIEGNATILYNAYADIYETQYGAWDSNNPLIDQHGTACAVAAAGKTCGIANKARILGVTCLDTSEDRGNNSFNVLNAFAWILQYIIDKKVELAPKPYPVVVSLSLGTSTGIIATAQDSCVAAMIAEGAIVVIAAGNDNAPHNESPYTPEAILVGASTEAITPCSFTNYGPHIDVYAPGEDIFSTVLGYTRWQGTSVATPHVSGLCALYLSLFPSSTAAEVKEAILQVSIDAVTYNKDATTNRFAQNPFYGFINREEITTPILQEEFIYVDIPYFIGFDGEKIYGSLNELTLSTIASAVVSAGKSESVDLATAIRLVP